MSKKLTYEFVKSKFEEKGYTLLSTEYVGNSEKLKYRCPNGHEHSISWSDFTSKKSARCPYCSGNQKFTYEYVKNKFEVEGYTLLSKEYTNNKTKLNYICPKGHKHSISFGSFQKGTRCPFCIGVAKLSFDYVKFKFEEEGYEILSKEYVNNKSKLLCSCPKGHVCKISWADFKQGVRCAYCASTSKPLFSYIKEAFENEGYTLLSTEYINSKNKLDYTCPKGHNHFISWNDFRNGNRCPYCSNKVKKTYEEVKDAFELEGYVLLSEKYDNCEKKLDYICLNGHKHSISWHAFSRGNRCPYCYGNVRYDYSFIKKEFEKEGYTLLSKEYTNSKSKLDFICNNKHEYSINWNDFAQGHRCGRCKGQIEVTYDQVKDSFIKEGYKLLSSEYVNNRTKLKCVCSNGHEYETTYDNFQSGSRCRICYEINNTGEGNPNWLGGNRDYCHIWSDKEYKANIRERDSNICQNPYCYKTTKKLHIHHIDYNKKNCHLNNLITVCASCNARANIARGWHKEWYQTILSKKFGYKY